MDVPSGAARLAMAHQACIFKCPHRRSRLSSEIAGRHTFDWPKHHEIDTPSSPYFWQP